MSSFDEYQRNFIPHKIPVVLIKLFEFEDDPSDFFSSGFELADDDKTGIKTWSENPVIRNGAQEPPIM
jgi:hypothetical protein